MTWVSPPIFGLQHCCRFRKRMQLNMGGLRLNTLFTTTFSIIFFFTSFSFSSISLPFCSLYFFFFYSFFFYFLLQRMLFLLCLSWCHKFQLHFMSLMRQRERSSTLGVLKWSHAHLQRRWQEFVGALSHNTSFTHCLVLKLIHAWFRWKLVGNISFSTNLWLTTLMSLP